MLEITLTGFLLLIAFCVAACAIIGGPLYTIATVLRRIEDKLEAANRLACMDAFKSLEIPSQETADAYLKTDMKTPFSQFLEKKRRNPLGFDAYKAWCEEQPPFSNVPPYADWVKRTVIGEPK